MNSIALSYEELDALDDVLDIYANLHSKSVLIDWYFRGVNYVEVLKLHEKIIRKVPDATRLAGLLHYFLWWSANRYTVSIYSNSCLLQQRRNYKDPVHRKRN